MRRYIQTVNLPEGRLGKWEIKKFTVSPEPSVAKLRLMLDGRGIDPGTYTKLIHDDMGLVMSDTTAEQRDHWEFGYSAKGHVLITGLGLGMCVAAAMRKPEVSRVTVIEIDADLINLVGPHYTCNPKVEIIHADAFEWKPPKGMRYGTAWHDIWVSPSTDVLPEMTKLKRRYKADWKGCWMEERLRREAKRNKEWERSQEIMRMVFRTNRLARKPR